MRKSTTLPFIDLGKDEAKPGEQPEVKTVPAVSVKPEAIFEPDSMKEAKQAIVDLAQHYQPGQIGNLFNWIARGSTGKYGTWKNQARVVINIMLDKARRVVEQTAVLVSDERNAMLRLEVKAAVERQMDKLEAARARLNATREKLRALTTGITGSSDIDPVQKQKKDDDNDLLQALVAFAGALVLDIALNKSLLRASTNNWEAVAFSVAVSLFGSLSALWAANTLKSYFAHKEAVANHKALHSHEGGAQGEVFHLPLQTKFMLVLSHVLFLGVALGTIWYRAQLTQGWGALAGSIGFTVVLIGFYLFKLYNGQAVHPRAAEQAEMKAEVARQETALSALEDFNNGDAKAVFDDYLKTSNRLFDESAQERRYTKETLIRLLREAQQAPEWFVADFKASTETLVAAIKDGERTETSAELDAAIAAAKPDFTLDIGIDFTAATNTANSIALEKGIPGQVKSLAEILPQAVKEVRDARKAEKNPPPAPRPTSTPWLADPTVLRVNPGGPN